MAGRSAYIIQFGGLPVGVHEFNFPITGTFFKDYPDSGIEAADVEVTVLLTKQNNVLQLAFNIEGTVDVDCDRCIKTFGYPVGASGELVVKHGRPEDSNDEILFIPEGEEQVDVAQYLYESIVLALPARRVPCELDAERYVCDFETLGRLGDFAPDGEQEPKNPMWEQLSKIKNNKN